MHGDGTLMRYRFFVLIGLAASSVFAQGNRDSYQIPYRAWRQAAPGLEKDAGTPGAAFAEQLKNAAESAQVFWNARAAYFETQAGGAELLTWAGKPLASAEKALTVPQEMQQLLAVAAAKAGNNIGAFPADDKDPAIRRVRQAMERERAALRALMDTLDANKASLTELIDVSDDAEIQRALAYQALVAEAGRRTQLAEHVKREAADWAQYYKDLGEGSNRTSTSSAAPAPSPAKIIRPNSGQMQIARFTGEWIFPNKGLFYGPQPEMVELVVEENGGRITGKLTAKFLMPMATLTFDFQGPVQQAKTLTFPMQAADGASGSIELIQGSAYNLLEVNFTSTAQPGSGNFVLVKR